MKKIKLVKKLLLKNEAQQLASSLRANAKKQGLLRAKVEIVNAYELFKVNGWFKKSPYNIGWPEPDQFMVLMHYYIQIAVPVAPAIITKKIVRAKKAKRLAARFFPIKIHKKHVINNNPEKVHIYNISTHPFRFWIPDRPYKASTARIIPLHGAQYKVAA